MSMRELEKVALSARLRPSKIESLQRNAAELKVSVVDLREMFADAFNEKRLSASDPLGQLRTDSKPTLLADKGMDAQLA